MKVDKLKIEIAMARAQLNKYDLAAKAEMPIPTVNALFARQSCKPATAGRVSAALGVDVTEILA